MKKEKKFLTLPDLWGTPSPLEGLKKVAVIGGGLGTAIAYPQAKKLHNLGADVTVITGFRKQGFSYS